MEFCVFDINNLLVLPAVPRNHDAFVDCNRKRIQLALGCIALHEFIKTCEIQVNDAG